MPICAGSDPAVEDADRARTPPLGSNQTARAACPEQEVEATVSVDVARGPGALQPSEAQGGGRRIVGQDGRVRVGEAHDAGAKAGGALAEQVSGAVPPGPARG